MTASDCPYPGLRPFNVDEGHLFFGRETQTDELLRRLHTTRFLAVVGPSGCGKSSLVRAGMIDALESGFLVDAGSRWRFVTMNPGDNPIGRLAAELARESGVAGADEDHAAAAAIGATLRRGPLGLVEVLRETPLPEATNLLVLVDQFEEIFRFRHEGGVNESDAFVSLLLASAAQRAAPIYIVITMRTEYIGHCAEFTGLPEALNRSQYLTPRLTRDQREEAITGPARFFGGDVAPDVVSRLLNEMGTDPDQLPLMQHLLMRMWTWRDRQLAPATAPSAAGADVLEVPGAGRTLTMADYDAVGGLRNALSKHADEAFQSLDARQQGIAAALFRRLSQRLPDGHFVRHPTPAGEAAAVAGSTLAELLEVVEVFRAPDCSFLTPFHPEKIDANGSLDITHEALIRQWSRLRDWAEDEAKWARDYETLADAAARREGAVDYLRKQELDTALDWRARACPNAAWAARYRGDFALAMTFLDESVSARAAQEAEREKRSRRRFRRQMLAATVGGAVLAIAGYAALGAAHLTDRQAYYRDFAERWGEPYGVGPLTADQARHRAASIKIVSQASLRRWWRQGQLYETKEVMAVDAEGRCRAVTNLDVKSSSPEPSPLNECRLEFDWDLRPEIASELAYDKNGSLRWGFYFLKGDESSDEREQPAAAMWSWLWPGREEGPGERSGYYVRPRGRALEKSPVEVIKLTYSPTGEEVQRRFYDWVGDPEPGLDHAYGQRRTYENGEEASETSIDADGRPMNDTAGNATLVEKYDKAGNLVEASALDKDRQPVVTKDGWQRVEMAYDANGNRTSIAYFDERGLPAVEKPSRAHRISYRYDPQGRLIETAFFDKTDKPVASRDGYARAVLSSFAPDGQPGRQEFFGPAGENATDPQGAHRYDHAYGGGLLVSIASFGPDGQPVPALQGCQTTRIDYDKIGHRSSEACFDSQGHAALFEDGTHRVDYRYDDRGNETERAYYGVDGNPVYGSGHYQRSTSTYDAAGNDTDREYLDEFRPSGAERGWLP